MQKIVLFIDEECDTPLKIGNLFMNRFAIEEDAASEVLKIFKLENTSLKMSVSGLTEYDNFEERKQERKQEGMDLIIKIAVYSISWPKSDKNVYSIEMS